jgi:hypothetical protein
LSESAAKFAQGRWEGQTLIRMDFDPVVERLVDKEVQNVNNGLDGADQSDSEIEEIEAEPRRPIAAGFKRSSDGVNNGDQAEFPEELDESFLCPLCSCRIPLQKVVSMPACYCLFCDSCLQSVVERELRGTPMKARENGWHIACPSQTCQGKLTAADCQVSLLSIPSFPTQGWQHRNLLLRWISVETAEAELLQTAPWSIISLQLESCAMCFLTIKDLFIALCGSLILVPFLKSNPCARAGNCSQCLPALVRGCK